MKYCLILLLMIREGFVFASPRGVAQTLPREALVTPSVTPFSSVSNNGSFEKLEKRLITAQISTCGYSDGDRTRPRTANSGYNCRVDTKNGLWGFCPTTVILASDCGLVGNCIDANACAAGCGIFGTPGITTFTWSVNSFRPKGVFADLTRVGRLTEMSYIVIHLGETSVRPCSWSMGRIRRTRILLARPPLERIFCSLNLLQPRRL